MLREAGLSETVKKGIPREQCVFVARKRGNDELAPPEDLFHDFDRRKKLLEREYGKGSNEAHNRAFLDCNYEERFREHILADPDALKKLGEISARAKGQEIYLVCYEGSSKACHRRILLRIAEERFGAKVAVDGTEPSLEGDQS